jgi:nitronate monooxygenase
MSRPESILNASSSTWLGTRWPIVQAPMAGVQDAALAIAVSNAGGLGSLPAAMLGLDQLEEQMRQLSTGTSQPYSVNFFCHVPPTVDDQRETRWRAALAPFYREFGIDAGAITTGPGRAPFSDASAEVLESFRPPVVSFHFGLPAAHLLKRVRSWGSRIFSSATTVDEARWLEAQGVDAVIAQGLEAGGHRGMFLTDDLSTQVGTIALLGQVKRAIQVPVIAAGGITDRAGAIAAFALGADAVQAGTAYLLADEALTSPMHRAALQSKANEHTALTNVFTGRPARGIMNRFMRELGMMSAAAPQFPLATSAMAPLRKLAEAQGSGEFSPLWAGQNAAAAQAWPAAKITRVLAGLE